MRLFTQTNLTNTDKTLLMVLAVWALVWKGIALWKASRNEQKYWYIALLILNTAGIAEIFFILFFQKNPVIKLSRFKKGKKDK
jgi:hypothetical protein